MRITLTILFFFIQLVLGNNSKAEPVRPAEKKYSFQAARVVSLFCHLQDEVEKIPLQETSRFKHRTCRNCQALPTTGDDLSPVYSTTDHKIGCPPLLIVDYLRRILFPNHNFW